MEWSTYFIGILWVLALLVLSHGMNWLGSRVFGRFYWIVVAPGVAVHELSHYLACKLTLTKVREVKLFSKEGGHVTHERRGVLVNTLIGTAPLFGSILMLALAGYVLLPGGLRGVEPGVNVVGVLKDAAAGVWFYFRDAGGYGDWRLYVFLLVAFNLTATLAPSAQDLRNSGIGLTLLTLLGAAVIFLQKTRGLEWWRETYLLDLVFKGLSQIVAWGCMAGALALVLIVPIYFIRKMTI